jgi:hypothetical protein
LLGKSEINPDKSVSAMTDFSSFFESLNPRPTGLPAQFTPIISGTFRDPSTGYQIIGQPVFNSPVDLSLQQHDLGPNSLLRTYVSAEHYLWDETLFPDRKQWGQELIDSITSEFHPLALLNALSVLSNSNDANVEAARNVNEIVLKELDEAARNRLLGNWRKKINRVELPVAKAFFLRHGTSSPQKCMEVPHQLPSPSLQC